MSYVGHVRTAVVERITDYTMSGARRGPDGRFVRVDGLRERLVLSAKTGVAPGSPSQRRARPSRMAFNEKTVGALVRS
jgi:hypothetical protein